MKAVILAAGVSRRLYPATYDIPKCLIKVGEKSIIDHQLDSLKQSEINNVTIVVGYHRETLIDHLETNYPSMDFNFIINHHYFETNTAYSLQLCDQVIRGNQFILLNADVLYPYELLNRLINSSYNSVLAVDVKACGKEEVKVIEGDNQRLVAIGKDLIEDNCLGEFIGVAKLSNDFSNIFFESLVKLIKAGGKSDYFEAAMHPILVDHAVYYENVSDLPCIEIDFVEDLENAKDLVKSDLFKK